MLGIGKKLRECAGNGVFRYILPFKFITITAILLIYLFEIRRTKKKKKYHIAICAIFKNEARYFQEWIEFHRIVGVEHFYLYNNFSSDNYEEILSPYISSGIVTIIDWSVVRGQCPAYEHCIKNYSGETDWLAFIDCDEFLLPTKDNHLKDVLKSYRIFPAFAAHWKMFGSSGSYEDDKEALVTEKYVVSEPCINIHIKTIVNTAWAKYLCVYNSHLAYVKHPFFPKRIWPILENYDFAIRSRTTLGTKTIKKLIINHYWCKSFEEYVNKKIPNGLADQSGIRTLQEFFYTDSVCTVADYSAYKFLTKLKHSLKQSI